MRLGQAIAPAEPPPLDTIVFQSPLVTVGAFRCPAWHPSFGDSGPIENDIFVFRDGVSACSTTARARSWPTPAW